MIVMDNIKDIVSQVIKKASTKKDGAANDLEEIWQSLLDKKEMEHTKILGMKDDRLWVEVDSPAWLYQMNLRRIKILRGLSREIPQIKSLYFKVGKVK